MERIKVSLSGNYAFSTIIAIRITDVNYGGHVGNDVFLSLVHEARLQFLQHYGYTELNFGGTGLIMADAGIEFKRELVYKDEVKISVTATGFDKLGFDILYLMEVKEGDKWITAGKVKTGMACYDYAAKKRVPVPKEAIEKLTANMETKI
ncbi:acyl-CoA thioesterase [Segetibacter koreensis]|uniref:acyl-CoA thioesterase n=1 Tax=Segetibacter koreensis TaxID=398037 RepID=UPI000360998A|nr:thioesterase family protein [Segetibacter koreensis]